MEVKTDDLDISLTDDDLLDVDIGLNEFEDEDEDMEEEEVLRHSDMKAEIDPCVSRAASIMKIESNIIESHMKDDTGRGDKPEGATDDDLKRNKNYSSYQNEWHQRRMENEERGYVDFKKLRKRLHLCHDTDPFVAGRELAYRLSELKSRMFGHVVRVLGTSVAVEIFEETKQLMEQGGLTTEDGRRKRTPGGTFLYLMRNRDYADADQMREIFREENKQKKKDKKKFQQKRKQQEKETLALQEANRIEEKKNEEGEEEDERLRRLSEESRRSVLTVATNKNTPTVANGNHTSSSVLRNSKKSSDDMPTSSGHIQDPSKLPIFVPSTIASTINNIIINKMTSQERKRKEDDEEEDGEISD